MPIVDPDRVVLFDDVAPFLVVLHSREACDQLMLYLLDVLGVHGMPLLLSTNDMRVHDMHVGWRLASFDNIEEEDVIDHEDDEKDVEVADAANVSPSVEKAQDEAAAGGDQVRSEPDVDEQPLPVASESTKVETMSAEPPPPPPTAVQDPPRPVGLMSTLLGSVCPAPLLSCVDTSTLLVSQAEAWETDRIMLPNGDEAARPDVREFIRRLLRTTAPQSSNVWPTLLGIAIEDRIGYVYKALEGSHG